MFVEGGIVRCLNVEQPGEFVATPAEALLDQIAKVSPKI